MTRKGFWLAVVVVIASNAFTLWAARSNRSGDPEAVLELTERELRLPPRETDNTAMALLLEWTDPQWRGRAQNAPGWFDRAKLASIGFDTSLPVTRENAASYRGQAPRSVYAVLENDGDAWRRYVESLETDADRSAAAGRSRLVLVDVGTDPAALRARHPERRRTVVVAASAGLVVVRPPSGDPFLKGRVNTVYPGELNVTKALRPVLEGLAPRKPSAVDGRMGELEPVGEPRYRVTVKWGRSFEPWVEGVQAIEGAR